MELFRLSPQDFLWKEIQGCRFGPESSRQTLVSPIFRSIGTICGGLFPKMFWGQICNLEIGRCKPKTVFLSKKFRGILISWAMNGDDVFFPRCFSKSRTPSCAGSLKTTQRCRHQHPSPNTRLHSHLFRMATIVHAKNFNKDSTTIDKTDASRLVFSMVRNLP